MGSVYLAHDEKHHRRVAVKVLRPELAASLGTALVAVEIGIRLVDGLLAVARAESVVARREAVPVAEIERLTDIYAAILDRYFTAPPK